MRGRRTGAAWGGSIPERSAQHGHERLCRACGDWWLIEQFQHYRTGFVARTCLACTRERRNAKRRTIRALVCAKVRQQGDGEAQPLVSTRISERAIAEPPRFRGVAREADQREAGALTRPRRETALEGGVSRPAAIAIGETQ